MLSDIIQRVGPDTALWMDSASQDDIAMAIEFGRHAVTRMNIVLFERSSFKNKDIESNIPVYKGQVGESFVESILRSKFSSVRNVTRVSKSGDLTLFIEHRKIIVEVKNYSNPVPFAGVEKFHRDLGTTNASGGVFVSLRTPITTITGDFAIRFESSDTKTIPCAYVVSDDEHAIIIAINMISQLISSTNYINSELYTKDKIIDGVHQIAGTLDDLSRTRNDLQCNINEVMNHLLKTSSSMVISENNIRRAIDSMKTDLFHTVTCNEDLTILELEKNQTYAKYPIDIKTYVATIISHVQNNVHRADVGGSAWKLSGSKCINTLAGIGFHFAIKRIDVILPRNKISDASINTVFSTPGIQATVDKHGIISIALDSTTFKLICDLITCD